jgi:hypothetical protein
LQQSRLQSLTYEKYLATKLNPLELMCSPQIIACRFIPKLGKDKKIGNIDHVAFQQKIRGFTLVFWIQICVALQLTATTPDLWSLSMSIPRPVFEHILQHAPVQRVLHRLCTWNWTPKTYTNPAHCISEIPANLYQHTQVCNSCCHKTS